jgi:hypothetical protein
MVGVALGIRTDSSISNTDDGREVNARWTALSGEEARRGWSPIGQTVLQSNHRRVTDE